MNMPGRPVAAFDPEGLIFAAGVNSEQVKLYDLRSFDKGPFNSFRLPQEKDCDWTGLKFSPDGKSILISTNGSVIRLIDAFQGNPLYTFGVRRRPFTNSFMQQQQKMYKLCKAKCFDYRVTKTLNVFLLKLLSVQIRSLYFVVS